MRKSLAVAVLLFAYSTASMAIYKCVGPNGSVAFQETPCDGAGQGGKIEVRPASGHAEQLAPPPAASTPAAPASNAYRQTLGKLEDERKRKDAWFVMRNAQAAVRGMLAQCDAEQKSLADSKQWSKNNLAGATRDSSISQEMQAAAMMCAERVRAKQKIADDAEKVCAEIKCIPAAL